MARTLSYVTQTEDRGKRLDALAAERALYPSRSVATRFIEEGRVFVNGATVTKKYLVSPGDIIVYEEQESATKTKLTGQNIPLDICYEDEHLLVFSKQAGLVCHPSPDHHDGTLVNALIYHCGIGNLCNVQGEEDDRLGIVHRLDMDTTGLMLAAKTNEAGLALMEAIQERKIDRRYLALAQGNIAHDTGMIDAPIARAANERMKMTVRDCESARDAVTTFKVLERFDAGIKDDGFTLIECKLSTGRTHQIRVHLQYIKHPCVGDPLYGGGNVSSQLGLDRQFLHSYRLEFEHPITGEHLCFANNLPADLQKVLAGIQDRSPGRTQAGHELLDDLWV